MVTGVIDNVMLTLEQTSQAVPEKMDGWTTIDQMKRVASYNGVGYGFITSKNLNRLVADGRAVRKVKGTVAYWRPVRGGAPAFGGGNVFLEPQYTPPGENIPGKPDRGSQDGGKTQSPEGDEWTDSRYLAAGAAGGASGAASGTVRGVITQIM